jgi:uncharacterized membrane protein
MRERNNMKEFIQKYKKEIIVAIFVFLIATLSFGLGYLTATKLEKTIHIVFEK